MCYHQSHLQFSEELLHVILLEINHLLGFPNINTLIGWNISQDLSWSCTAVKNHAGCEYCNNYCTSGNWKVGGTGHICATSPSLIIVLLWGILTSCLYQLKLWVGIVEWWQSKSGGHVCMEGDIYLKMPNLLISPATESCIISLAVTCLRWNLQPWCTSL